MPKVWVQVVKPTVISTFAGCGGSSLGYKLAGFKELLAVEWDDNAVETFKLNFPDVPVYHGDIGKLSGQECMKLANIKPGELDVFDGSPPCQGFSTAGKRKFDDPRNSLFKEYARLLKELQPKVFVMENVTGMVKGVMKQAYLQIVKTLRECGYQVRGEVLNAMYYNVPQSRQRVILIGVRNDLGIQPSHPQPQTKPIVLREALKNVLPGDTPQLCPKYLKMAPKIKAGECAADYDPGKGFQNLVRPYWNKVCFTLTKMNPGNGRGTPLHPTENRSLSISEAKRISSFPDDFVFVGPFIEKWARIGNSVPPNLMRAIALHIKTKILRCPT
jgi:DNA (cytosine-5)-methyltransferase 1